MERIHFSDQPLVIKPVTADQLITNKPIGLWYSIEGNGDGWSDWCRAENFRDTSTQINHTLDVDLSQMCVLSNADDIRAFTKRYTARDPRIPLDAIDWTTVATQYAGIEISPYCNPYYWKLRLTMFWYYSWDCASGCVWDINAVRVSDQSGDR